MIEDARLYVKKIFNFKGMGYLLSYLGSKGWAIVSVKISREPKPGMIFLTKSLLLQ